MNKNSSKTKQMAVIGLMTAVVCIIAPISLNIPISPVPLSLGTMAIYFTVTVLGMKRGTVSVLLYILLGLAGLPVLSNFTGGAGRLFGPTGGYMIGYIFLSLILGFFVDHWKNRPVTNLIGALLATLVLYLFGTLWLAYQLHLGFMAALWAGVIPYIPGDLVKIAIALAVGMQLRKRLLAADLV